jgi:hypothetical protein
VNEAAGGTPSGSVGRGRTPSGSSLNTLDDHALRTASSSGHPHHQQSDADIMSLEPGMGERHSGGGAGGLVIDGEAGLGLEAGGSTMMMAREVSQNQPSTPCTKP